MKFLIIFVTLAVFVSSVISVPAKTPGQNLDGAIGVVQDVRDTANEEADKILNDLWNQLQESTQNAVDQTNQVLTPQLQDVQQLLQTNVDLLVGALNNNLNNAQKELLNGLTIVINLDAADGLTAKITLA